uniref:ATP synthase complex subunit 8 n=2 Tax=Dermestes TaxID=219541 RepID=A0A6C0RVA2_9COLE|nr:ATP synthase F0 subunit 8 [Dermestes tessellatocollis]QEK77714.1 ATP synthase F0 subunit 8 [Dermestes tessellatocollis]QIA46723.1 ATP synthase F0 subunit 8 [Dermestes maculatus]
MPQMAPMNWLMLFFFFTITFMVLNSMNFFQTNYSSKSSITKKSSKKINWKW